MKLTAVFCLFAATLAVADPNPDQDIDHGGVVDGLVGGAAQLLGSVVPEQIRPGHARRNVNLNPEPRIGVTVEPKGGPSRRNADSNSPMDLGDPPPNKFATARAPSAVEYPSGGNAKPQLHKSEVVVVSEGGAFPRNADPEPGYEETRPRITRSDWPPPIRV
ncbi:hypothetical protein BO94DRAFT_585695 [Aspergillus sclerotioniger CBS 115572]|uniref:Uncharacterized protein n=1 Tax=Aspergillus sclerotioniger CBS 115572 TaxID=1450535 RepID=A0A317WLC1_9EURO|nr:hypothetical protein BO94DRAFT_585695 [Aspergillus sclerotioniger CBS 115572]PWY87129.1 hypothetical protein BO94DRAFT_585695 [Aspergillus sclerotioniger CBS 115572]